MTATTPEDLLPVLEVAFTTSIQGLRRCQSSERRIVHQISELKEARRLAARPDCSEGAPTGAGLAAWMAWGDRRLAELQSRLAAQRVHREEVMSDLRQAYGRKAAVEALVARQRQRAKMRQARPAASR